MERLHRKYDPIGEDTCARILRNGDIECLRAVHDSEIVPLDWHDYIRAGPRCLVHNECIMYLGDIHVITPRQILLDAATWGGSWRLARYAREHGENLLDFKVYMSAVSHSNFTLHTYCMWNSRTQIGTMQALKQIVIGIGVMIVAPIFNRIHRWRVQRMRQQNAAEDAELNTNGEVA